MEITNKQVKITISFKANELWMYDEICKHSGKGNWIKDILSEYLSYEKGYWADITALPKPLK